MKRSRRGTLESLFAPLANFMDLRDDEPECNVENMGKGEKGMGKGEKGMSGGKSGNGNGKNGGKGKAGRRSWRSFVEIAS